MSRSQVSSVPSALLVEDNPTNQLIARLLLEALGFEVRVEENGQKGLDAWRGGGHDCVFMDVQMPEMDGLAAIRAIRLEELESGRARTPIAVVSANAMAHDREAALRAGADVHIAKPVSLEALQAALDQWKLA